MTETKQPKQLSIEYARELAGDLIRQLAEHVGDEKELDAVFLRWLDVLDVPGMYLVCTAAMRTTFVDCLSLTPARDFPAGSIAMRTPQEDQ